MILNTLIQILELLRIIAGSALNTKAVLTLDELVIYSGLSKSFIYKMTSSNDIPHFYPRGKTIYFNRAEIDSWLLKNKVKTNADIQQEAVNHIISGGV